MRDLRDLESQRDQLLREASPQLLRRISPATDYGHWVNEASDDEVNALKAECASVIDEGADYHKNAEAFLREIVRRGSYSPETFGFVT